MHHRAFLGGLALLVAAALPLTGCGENDNSNSNGGSGSRCGNDVVDTSGEQCDGTDLDGATCTSLGFSAGTLGCNSSCRFVTSGCTGTSRTPTPAPTPTSVQQETATPVVGATETATPGNPTATPTPGGPTCSDGDSIVVRLSLSTDITSARLDLGYPASANLPGSGTDKSVKDRVAFAGSGLTVVNDSDNSGDLVDDTLTMSLVSTDVSAAGLFATVTFDCVAGQPQPSAGDFICTVVSASLSGGSVSPNCSVAIQ